MKARTEGTTQLKSLLVTTPEPIRAESRSMTTVQLIKHRASSRARTHDDVVSTHTRFVLKRFALRYRKLDAEIAAYDTDLARLVEASNPALTHTKGIGTATGTQLLITAGDNPDRMHSEAAFAMLCGAAPIPAPSGRTTRHRLNRGGDRSANSALHRIALIRLATDPHPRAYAARRATDGKSKKDVLRCLKRALAREVFHLITNPQPADNSSDLRRARRALNLTLADVGDALACRIGKTSRIERGTTRDARFLHDYRAWLSHQQSLETAA